MNSRKELNTNGLTKLCLVPLYYFSLIETDCVVDVPLIWAAQEQEPKHRFTELKSLLSTNEACKASLRYVRFRLAMKLIVAQNLVFKRADTRGLEGLIDVKKSSMWLLRTLKDYLGHKQSLNS